MSGNLKPVYKASIMQAFMLNCSHYNEMTLEIIRDTLPNIFEDFLDCVEQYSLALSQPFTRWTRQKYDSKIVNNVAVHEHILRVWNVIMEKG